MLLKTGKKDFYYSVTLLIVVAIFVYGMYLRVYQLAGHSLWGDEINELKSMEGNFVDLLRRLPSMELNSYLNWDHFLIYPFFKIFSYNKWGLAIPHIIATIIAFYFLFLNSKRFVKTVIGYLIVFWIFSVNVNLVQHATEIRPYAVLPALALAVLYFTELLAENPSMYPKKKLLICLFFIVTILFHTYGIFIVAFCLAFSLLSRWNKDFIKSFFNRNIKMLLIILAISLPYWFYSVLGPKHVDVSANKLDVFRWIPSPINNLPGFLKGIFGNLVGFKVNYLFLIGLIFPFILPYKERFKQILFFFVMILFPLLLILICDMIFVYYFIQRQFIWVMPFFALLLGWIFDSSINYIFPLNRNNFNLKAGNNK